MRPKDTHCCLYSPAMSKQVLVSMLRQGNTASEILSILDAIVSGTLTGTHRLRVEQVLGVPTLTEIDF